MDKMVLSTPTDFIHDKRKDGWALLADIPLDGNPTLEISEFLRDNERYVTGEVMLSRAVSLWKMTGQRHAERMLAIADKIPESWRAFVLVFPGTVWNDGFEGRVVPCLFWRGDQWCLRWSWLTSNLYEDSRLVRVSQT